MRRTKVKLQVTADAVTFKLLCTPLDAHGHVQETHLESLHGLAEQESWRKAARDWYAPASRHAAIRVWLKLDREGLSEKLSLVWSLSGDSTRRGEERCHFRLVFVFLWKRVHLWLAAYPY